VSYLSSPLPFVLSLYHVIKVQSPCCTSTIVKVAVIAPWIHHGQVKPASLEWKYIPDPASPCRIILQNLSTLPRQVFTSQEMTEGQEQWNNSPALLTTGSWLVYTWQKLEESTLQQDKWVVFHPSYLTVMHCHLLSVSAVVVLTLVFTIDLAETTLADWSHIERFSFALFYLFWAGCIITIYCYWSGLTKEKIVLLYNVKLLLTTPIAPVTL
jgi:hypothetical protein